LPSHLVAIEDLLAPEHYATEAFHDTFRHLRAMGGVAWTKEADGPGLWSVGSHAGVSQVLRGRSEFTSEKGMMLGLDREKGDPAAGKMLVVTDPPRHTDLRSLMSAGFTPRRVAQLSESVDAAVEERLKGLLDEDVDLVPTFSAWIPCATTCALLGVPEPDWPKMYELTAMAFGAEDPELGSTTNARAVRTRAHASLLSYFAGLVRERRARPLNDLISVLTHGEVGGRRLSDEEILLNCDNVIIGGNETTRQAINWTMVSMATQAGAWPDEISDSFARTAVDEILRCSSPALHMLRVATRDSTIGDVTVREGDTVALWLPSANRDESVFEDADEFRPTRKPNRHLALGIGHHFCMGSALAKVELECVLRAVTRLVGSIDLVGEPTRLQSLSTLGYTRVTAHLQSRRDRISS
jgi:cytochrome P450